MIQPPQQYLLMGLDASVGSLLALAEQSLGKGQPVVLIASCAGVSSIPQLEAWYALKNTYLSQLTLFFTLRDEPQLYPVLEGAITGERLAELQPSVFDAVRLAKASIAGPAPWIAEQVQSLVSLGMAADAVEQLVDELEHDAEQAEVAQAQGSAAKPELQAVQVRVTMQGRELQFGMDLDGTTVLDAAEDAGLDLPYSCRGGVCSTCRTRVLQGAVDMLENSSLDDWEVESGYVLACQAVPSTTQLHISYDEI